MSAIGPGDVVECINAQYMEDMVTVGQRYTVQEIIPRGPEPCVFDGCGDGGVVLVDVIHYCGNPFCAWDGIPMIFCVHRFRPIYKREAGAFDHMLTTTEKEREREDA